MDSWLSTGAMSRASGLSVKALRLYQDSGLLTHARVDETTGYRAYHPDQVATGRTLGCAAAGMDSELSTGAMSRASCLSVKALRLYHDSGLLTPARVDETTGYRAYHPDQVETGRTIGLLRRAGMPIDQIHTAL